ncbi:Mitogen-activated protein kinase kinase kinase [Sergentomyia squamirostris]
MDEEENGIVLTISTIEFNAKESLDIICFSSSQDQELSDNQKIHITVNEPIPLQIVTTNFREMEEWPEEGSNLELKCEFSGYPEPDIQWYKNHDKLSNHDKVSIVDNGTRLVIKSLTADDQGIYRCVGHNKFESLEKSTKIILRSQKKSSGFSYISLVVLIVTAVVVIIAALFAAYSTFISRSRPETEQELQPLKDNQNISSRNRIQRRPLRLRSASSAAVTYRQPDVVPSTSEVQMPVIVITNEMGIAREYEESTSKGSSSSESEDETCSNKSGAYIQRSDLIRQKREQNQQGKVGATVNFVTLCRAYDFPVNQLKFTRDLGSGHFGEVRHAFAQNLVPSKKKTAVTVKSYRKDDKNGRNALLSEIQILTQIGEHKNLVNLMGIIIKNSSQGGEIMIMVEYCTLGNMRDFLIRNNDRFNDEINHDSETITSTNTDIFKKTQIPFSTTHLVSWSYQVARGMVFLSSKNVIHGDLTAKNILLCNDHFVKICDFGLSKIKQESNYYLREGPAMPIKWVALESFENGLYNSFTDIWSFGVVLWEFFSLGKEPYEDISSNLLRAQLINGYRLEKPRYATETLYNLMRRCWVDYPRARPSFEQLKDELDQLISNKIKSKISSHDSVYNQMNLRK